MPIDRSPHRDAYIAAVDILGDAWTFLITREAFFGARRFQDFCDALKISRARLTERLKHLVDRGIFEKHQYDDAPPRFEYRFTKRGRAIYPMALTLIAWGEKWRSCSGASKLVHTQCGKKLHIRTVCETCGEPVRANDLRWPHITSLESHLSDSNSVRGWRKMASFDDLSNRPDPAVEALKAVGDRWSMLIIYGGTQREFRFREAQSKLGIAHNILTNRLGHLVREGILERVDDSRNAAYLVTESGREILDTILTMRSWAVDWVPKSGRQWAKLTHKSCGANVKTVCICAHCNRRIDPCDVSY